MTKIDKNNQTEAATKASGDHKSIPGVTWNEDGSATIDLKQRINVSGEKKASIRMNYPSVTFMRENNEQIKTLDGENDAIAELCGIAPEETGQIGWPDYLRVQRVFSYFLGGDAPNWQMQSSASAS
ncbi:phage tail assembly protein [Thalassospira marina]|nr:phage tail assembly protein [Thalassospira marina]